jgi:D-lactate dehydrogenase (cytochrome)
MSPDTSHDRRNARQAPPALLDELKKLLGERLSTGDAVREQHGHDESYHATMPPDAVAFAETTEDVSKIVAACARYKTPVIAFGTGTSLEGHVAAVEGGITIDLSRMNKILEVNSDDLDCRVQAGVTRKQLNNHLRDTGLFFPIDPGADASLGGMAATRASGTNAVRYGTMRENVLGLTVVMADGRVIRTGGRARKSAAGYDLTRLFVGSEGTLGIATEVQLRLYGQPDTIRAAVADFPSVKAAVDTVILTIQSGIPVARIELLDAVQMDAVNRYSKLDYAVRPTLFFEFHGSEASTAEQVSQVEAIAGENGAGRFHWATTMEERTKLWQARHDAYYAALALRPGKKGWPTDVCVPISRLADCIGETLDDLKQSGLLAPLVGHVGDGNFHLVYVIDPTDETEVARAAAHNSRMVKRAIAMGGTATGEHGIGSGKRDYLAIEHGEGAVAAMRALKAALDPDNIMNPGKVV